VSLNFIFSIPCIIIPSVQCYHQVHTLLYYGSNVLIHKFLHVLGLTAPSSGSAQLYKIIIQPFSHSQYVELSLVCQGMNIVVDMCTLIWAACRFE